MLLDLLACLLDERGQLVELRCGDVRRLDGRSGRDVGGVGVDEHEHRLHPDVEELGDDHAVVESVTRPYEASAVSRLASAALPPREPVTAGRVVTSALLNAENPPWIFTPEAKSDTAAEADALLVPLGSRLGFVQVRNPAQWAALRRLAPALPPACPDLSRGVAIAIVSRLGRPVTGRWPVRWSNVRLVGWAGFVEAQFEAGTYWPDGTTYLDAIYVPGLQAVLAIDVNGIRYYPD